MGLETTPGMAEELEKVGISGVCGARPAWPLVMSYPALIEKPDIGGPTGGAVRSGTTTGGGLTEGAIGEKEEETVEGK